MNKCIVYIGEFDLRNQNVQAHLVSNNGKIFNSLGYTVAFVGVNRSAQSFDEVEALPKLQMGQNSYLELPDTLSVKGVFKCGKICKAVVSYLNRLVSEYEIEAVITYQAPTFAVVLKRIADWCRANGTKYVVNCADLPIFELQSLLRRCVMKINWVYLYKVNKKYADGVIAVSRYIDEFYRKDGRVSAVVPPLFDISTVTFEPVSNSDATFCYAGTPFKLTGHEADPKGMKDRLDKVIDLFLELSKRSVSYKFNIVGITREEYLSGVPRHTEVLLSEERIVFLGRQSHSDTLKLIKSSDFSVNYRDENLMTMAGFSTKIVESVSLGTPVVINSISDTFEYVNEGVSGFEITGDTAKDVEKLCELCCLSAEKRAQLKKDCFNEKVFSIEQYKTRLASFLEELQK